jgi:hypothetical protein
VKYWWEETESNLSDETEWIPVVAALTDQTLENEIELMATYVGEQVKCVEWVVFASADCAVVIAWVCLTVVVFVDLAWMKAAAVVDELSFVPDYYRHVILLLFYF